MAKILLQKIHDIQSYLYGGYKNTQETNTQWLSTFSFQFIELFKMLQNHLSKEVNAENKYSFANQSFLLCARQIMICIKYLEKTTRIENLNQITLITSRQCFFGRILWCLGRLQNTISSKVKNNNLNNEECSFIDLLDDILDSLQYFLKNDEHNTSNKAERRANLMIESSKIEENVKELLSMAMTFCNISLEFDKRPLTVLSQKLFKIANEFKKEFSLADSNKNISSNNMKAIELENALCKLENFINDALLRLVYQTFNDINSDPFKNLLENMIDSDLEKIEIEKFDTLIERFLLIGQFAISFCKEDVKISSVIRSCLASIETLDSYLIPAISSKTNDPSIEILKLHFFEESLELQTHIHFIIDTKAFCESLIEQLIETEEKNKKEFNRSELFQMIEHSNILLTHFKVNSTNLNLTTDKVLKFYFNDFKLILKECEAILNYPEPIENFEKRVLKRFNILKNTIKKILSALKIKSNEFEDNKKAKEEEKINFDEEMLKSNYFNTIRPSALGSILYHSKRSQKKEIPKLELKSLAKKSPAGKVSSKRNDSMRMAMFKKNQEFKIDLNDEEKTNNETDLHITEILDQLSNLSIHIAKN
ncbi:hypothetical protein PVAND_001598 [Polypedilum vanderplanki]|uniref:Serendipity locus protein alpha n=1 Tax=Polypedilum vanderplanki TaxID=319348 RepID=A0A9J6BNW6_POLVA|nr:hypothetical protein PVAND_001598 [Polypedilum vanderplanki]